MAFGPWRRGNTEIVPRRDWVWSDLDASGHEDTWDGVHIWAARRRDTLLCIIKSAALLPDPSRETEGYPDVDEILVSVVHALYP